jgi:branched-chain amino acid transport system ATP-binding protein
MPSLLVVEKLKAGYGEAVVLPQISLEMTQGQVLGVLGRNGTGKTTLINSIVGVTRRFAGSIQLDGKDLTWLRPDQRAHAGIGWVPQERNIFRSLTVEENLTAVARPGPWTLDRIYKLFPRLQERRRNLGSQLSGGEQQMLAVGRALVLNPRILLLDEPFEGLAPILVEELLVALRSIIRGEGVSAILVEQNARKVLSVTDRTAILDRGSIVFEDYSEALRGNPQVLEAHLGVTERRAHRLAHPTRH